MRTPARSLLERVARVSQTGRTISEQAHAMGVNTDTFRGLRRKARAAGFRVDDEREVHRGRPSPRWQSVLAEMEASPPCPVDGLRGTHKCTAGRIQDYARSGLEVGG